MTDPRPRHHAPDHQHRPSNANAANEQRRIDDIVRQVSDAFASELSSIVKRDGNGR